MKRHPMCRPVELDHSTGRRHQASGCVDDETEVGLVRDLLPVLGPSTQVAAELQRLHRVERRLVDLAHHERSVQTRPRGHRRLGASLVLLLTERGSLVLERRHVPLVDQVVVPIVLLLGRDLRVLTSVAGCCSASGGGANAVEGTLEFPVLDVRQVPLAELELLGRRVVVGFTHQASDLSNLSLCLGVITEREEVLELRTRQHVGVPHVGLEATTRQLLVHVQHARFGQVDLVVTLRKERGEVGQALEQDVAGHVLAVRVIPEDFLGDLRTEDHLDDVGDGTVATTEPQLHGTLVLEPLEELRRLHTPLVDAEPLRNERVGQQVAQLDRDGYRPRACRVAAEHTMRHHLAVNDATIRRLEGCQSTSVRADGISQNGGIGCHGAPPDAIDGLKMCSHTSHYYTE